MNVLLAKVSSLGDIVHTLPALADAARHGARFDWVVEEDFQPVAALGAGVQRVLPVAFRRWRAFPAKGQRELRAFLRRLRQRRYDLALDAQGLIKSALVARSARAGLRAGFDAASARERPAALGYQRRVRVPRSEHAIARLRRLFAAAIGYETPNGEPAFGLRCASAGDDSVVLLHGTSWHSKLWPEAFWIDLGRRIAGAGLTPTLPWHGGERARAARIAAAVPNARLCPPTDLRGAVDVVAAARAVVGVDSGLAHLGAAFGKPTVMVFGPTDPRLTGGRGAHVRNLAARVPCAPCLSRRCRLDGAAIRGGESIAPVCLAAVAPDRVWSALVELMDGAAAARVPAAVPLCGLR